MAAALYDRHMLHPNSQTTPEKTLGTGNDTIYIKLGDFTEQESKVGGRPAVWQTSSVHQAKDSDDKYRKYALVLRRRLDYEGELLSMTLDVYSQHIREYLQSLTGDYPLLSLTAFPIQIKKPWGLLFHYRQKIRQDTESLSQGAEKEHLQVLVDFIKKYLGDTEREFQQNVQEGNPAKISFENVWALFQPGTVVISQGIFHECYEVVSYEYQMGQKGRKLIIEVTQWDYNGEMEVFGPAEVRLKIRAFVGLQQISTLSVCPLNFAKDDPESSVDEEVLRDRGQQWRKLVAFGHKEYNGAAWVDNPRDEASKLKNLVPIHVTGRIIIDCRAHERENLMLKADVSFIRVAANDSEPTAAKSSVDDNIRHKSKIHDRQVSYKNVETYNISDEMAIITPARVRGYSLQRKVWAFFLVDCITPIEWKPVHFDRLKLDEGVKDIVLFLVQSHQSILNSPDTIATKGSGLVMLLHGPPGSGKTLTAGMCTHEDSEHAAHTVEESIAEKTKRPLLALSSGDLGTNPDVAERRLRLHFDLAKNWGAVILLDEADVFLAKRTAGNIGRNAFVSIFLRLLEYYQGILFLTTNRVDEFDTAFQSRVHFSISYPALDSKQRSAIWKDLIEGARTFVLPAAEAADSDDSRKEWPAEVYDRLGEQYDINGREIKNLIHVASIVAGAQSKPLTEDSIHRVFKLNHRPKERKQWEEVEEDIEDELEDLTIGSSFSAPDLSSRRFFDPVRARKRARARDKRRTIIRRRAALEGVQLSEVKGREATRHPLWF